MAGETHFATGAAFEPALESPFRDERADVVDWDDEAGWSAREDAFVDISPFGEGEGLPEDDEEGGSGDDPEQEEAAFPAPRNLGAPFAPDPPLGATFPVRSTHHRRGEVAYQSEDGRRWGSRGRRFGASRGNGRRRHAGIDLYARRGDEVVACQDGTITAFYGFCCGKRKTSWALVVDHGNLVINYGEVEPDSLSRLGLSRGATVRAGQVIAHIGRNPGGSSMLHFETYAPGTAANLQWRSGSPPPTGLWDPTRYLLLLTPTPPSGAAGQPGLRRGSRGAAVRRLQVALTAAGFPTVVDGDFGPSTEAAVRTLQGARGLVTDGVVGAQTWAALTGVGTEAEIVPPDEWDEVRVVEEENAAGNAAGDFGLYDWEEAFLEEEAEEEEVSPLSSSRLDWPDAPAGGLEFMRAVYDRHVARSRAAGATFTADLPPKQLGVIEGPHQARNDAAEAARALLAEARAALAAEGLAGKVRIGIVSAYRPASVQFKIWQGKGRRGGFPYYYRRMLKRGRLRPGDYGPRAVEAMAKEIGTWIAAPGYSNHQDGLAIDFGTGEVGRKGFGRIGERAWFHKWLVQNAARFGFHPYHKEAWHWTYRGPAQSELWLEETASAGVRAGRLEVARVPLLARHRGNPPALVLRWNDMPAPPQEVDVVVHLHGYSRPGMRLPRHIEPYSGLDLAPVDGAAGRGRSRPTLTVLPRAHFTGVKQKHGNLYIHTFPALVAKDALPKLVRFSLEQFAAEVGGMAPRVARLILTAHSGGGQPLMEILKHHDPHEVHVFDALYWPPGPLVEWTRRHIRQDRGGTPSGALRVFYRRGTRRFSRQLLEAISGELAPAQAHRYRIEKSTLGHWQIPRQYGWRILADPAADVPSAEREPLVRREAFEVDLEEDDFEVAPFDEWDETEDFEEAEDPEPVAATAAYEALSSAFEVSNLDRARAFSQADEAEDEHEALSAALEAVDLEEESPLWEAEEAEEDFELGTETSEYEALSAAHEAADLAAEDALWEVQEPEDEQGGESGEVELGEAEAFLEDLYSLEPAFEEETGETVTFPNGATLRVVSGPTGPGELHYDPNTTGNPLLDTSESVRSTRLSTDFTVGELVSHRRGHFDKARIDPELVRCLQKLRDHVGKAVRVTSGYRPYLYNAELYKKRGEEPTASRHSSGQGADVKIAGMTGLEIAKAAIDACGTEIGVGIGDNYAHVDVRGKWSLWTYPRKKPPNRRWVAEINAHRRQRLAAGPAAPSAHDGVPPAGVAPQMLDALGRGLWDTAVRIAIGAGITDVNRLTNMLFYLRHPELRGKRIEPHQRQLAREWIEIRDRWVKPALSADPVAAPATPGAPAAAQFTRKTRESERFAALVPLLERYRGDIPLDFLLGWIDVESNGRIDVTTSMDERGFFQIHPAESKDNKLEHERLSTDPEYSVWAGIRLVRVYVELTRKRYPWIPFGSGLFWRVVKLNHAMGSGLTKTLLSEMLRRGISPMSWEAIKAFEPTEAAQQLHRLLRVKPGRFGRNVDEVFVRGRRIAAALGT